MCYWPIKESSEVAKELHSPTKEHVREYFHSREQGKYYPVHHPFHLKGHSHRVRLTFVSIH